MICNHCQTIQKKSRICKNCNLELSKYFCDLCNIWTDFNIYHCDKCNVCFKTKPEDRIHCDTCNLCFENNVHTCIGKFIDINDTCCICFEQLYLHIKPAIFSKCGHAIHQDCLQDMIKQGNFSCPLCKKTMIEMDWNRYKKFIESHPIEEQKQVNIQCNDCLQSSNGIFHPFGISCLHCDSFNTFIL
jgi:RING finger/CHY zinc finger protein 1